MARKAKVIRKTLAQKLDEAREDGHSEGFAEGRAFERRAFLPASVLKRGLDEFVGLVHGWTLDDNAIVQIFDDYVVDTSIKYVIVRFLRPT